MNVMANVFHFCLKHHEVLDIAQQCFWDPINLKPLFHHSSYSQIKWCTISHHKVNPFEYILFWVFVAGCSRQNFQSCNSLKLSLILVKIGSFGKAIWTPLIVKACVNYFISIFFHQIIALQKLWKLFFISSRMLFSFSRYSNVCNFFPFQTFQIQKGKWNWNNLWCHEMACINLQM